MSHRDLGIDGWWIATDGELGGVPLPPDALSDLSLRISRGSFRLGTDEGRMVISGRGCPRSLDLILTRGPNRGRVLPAILEITGSVLRICGDLSGAQRPGKFAAPPGTRHFLVHYHRAKAALPTAATSTLSVPGQEQR